MAFLPRLASLVHSLESASPFLVSLMSAESHRVRVRALSVQ